MEVLNFSQLTDLLSRHWRNLVEAKVPLSTSWTMSGFSVCESRPGIINYSRIDCIDSENEHPVPAKEKSGR